MNTLPAIGFIVLTLLCVALLLRGTQEALKRREISPKQRPRTGQIVIVVVMFWMAVTAVLSLSGFTSNFSSVPPHIAIVLIPPFVAIIILTFTPSVRKLLASVPPAWLIGIQTFRVVVELLLWMLFMQHRIPVQMTFEGRNFDVLAGLTAPVVAYFCFVRKSWPKAVAIVWNIAGLALLLNIVSIAILSMPTPLRVFMNEPANTIVGAFPFVWLPAILVPLAFSMHLFSLRQLLASNVYQSATV